MKMLAFALTLLFSFSAAHAANINQGDWELGGGFNLSKSSGSTSTFSSNLAAQHFFADNFSAGFEAVYRTASSSSSISAGPAFSVYFPVHETTVPYLRLVPIEVTDFSFSSSFLSSEIRAGLKFFFTEAVAFGPAVYYTHYWPENGGSSSNAIGLLGIFSIHL